MSLAVPPSKIVIFGRPGSGKSSLAERLGSDFGYILVRTGEMLREAVRRGDGIGHEVGELLQRGALVSDELMFQVLEANLTSPGTSRLLFDGYPRTLGQIPSLERLERDLKFQVDCYLDIAISRDSAVRRMTGRRVCPRCGATYHMVAKPPRVGELCDVDQVSLERRADDKLDVVEHRQDVYDQSTDPVVRHYERNASECFLSVNGDQAPDAVYAEAVRALGLVKP